MIVIQSSCCVCLPEASACNTSVLSPLTPLCRIGLLLLGKPLDRESTDQYRLIVTASDGNPGGVRRNSFLVVLLQSWQTTDFSNSLIWKRSLKYRTSTEQLVREQKLYWSHLLLQRGCYSSKPSKSPCSTLWQSEPQPSSDHQSLSLKGLEMFCWNWLLLIHARIAFFSCLNI